MANTIVVVGDPTFIREVEIGTVYVYLSITWNVKVGLTGVPAITLTDGLGNTHKPEKAMPHIAVMADWEATTIFRYQSVPAFADYEVTIPIAVAGITDAGGNGTFPATHTATPA
jgi:hypothetical protein